MAEYEHLSYKTRAMSSPQGRPRVFFCCAEADFARLFEPVTNEILELQKNAAIWYAPPGTPMEGEAFLSDLSQMQLLVVPVTSKFVFGEDPARTVAYVYASEHRIPILPLLFERGLEKDFNRVCGERTMLSRVDDGFDSAAVPYTEKLRRFLETVLISDELAERVRSAFDACIFLSYRRVDRAAAQKVMRLIHENDFCRDVAIWYDEFLMIGENFNSEIANAMSRSALYTMVVTPNLLRKPNYVLSTEYPEAKKRGMPILPIAAAAADESERAALDREIPGIIEAEDSAAVAEQLRQLLSGVDLRASDDPMHTLLIGIAYLSGIDMEVDHARAVSLITEAAEAGLVQALRKLVSMYQNGEGVERNYRTAIEWQERLVGMCRKTVEEEPTAQMLWLYFIELRNLCDALLSVDDPAGAESAAQRAIDCASRLLALQEPDARRVLADSFQKMGDICERLGRPEETLSWYRKGLALCEEQAAETNTKQARKELSSCCHNLGAVSQRMGRPEDALIWIRKSLEIQEALSWEKDSEELRQHLGTGYHNLGILSERLRDPEEALAWYRKSLELLEPLVEETNSVHARRTLSVTLNDLGNFLDRIGRPAEALGWHWKNRTLLEALVEETNTVEARRDLALCYFNLGLVSDSLGSATKAQEWYGKCLALREAIAQETTTLQSRRELDIGYGVMGSVCFRLGRLQEALAWYQKSLALRGALAQETNMAVDRQALALSFEQAGILSHRLRRPAEALEQLRKCLALREALCTELNTPQSRRELSDVYRDLGDYFLLTGNPAEAQEWFLKRVSLHESLLTEEDADEARLRLADSYDAVGDVKEKMRRPAEARDWYRKSLRLRESLQSETGGLSALHGLAENYMGLGRVSRQLGESEAELEWQRKSLEAFEELARRTDMPVARRDLSACYIVMGEISDRSGDLPGALMWYRRSLEIREQLAQTLKTIEAWDDLAVCCYKLGTCPLVSREECRAYLTRVLQIGQTLLRHTGSPRHRHFVDEAKRKLATL